MITLKRLHWPLLLNSSYFKNTGLFLYFTSLILKQQWCVKQELKEEKGERIVLVCHLPEIESFKLNKLIVNLFY